jgi:hypothetical protein
VANAHGSQLGEHMTDSPEDQGPTHSGEAAWRAAKDAVAARNAQARRAGKQRREAQELQAARARAAAERREMAELIGKSDDR